MNTILDIKNKYNILEKNLNNLLNINNKNEFKEMDLYNNYLIEENYKIKNIINKYEILLDYFISYINDINNLFKLKQIEYFKLRQKIINDNTNEDDKIKYINGICNFLKKCKEYIIYKNFNIKINKTNKTNIISNIDNKSYIDKSEVLKECIKDNQNQLNSINPKIKRKSRDKYSNSVSNPKIRHINNSCDSIYHSKNDINNLLNTLMNAKKKRLNLSKKKKKRLKNKDTFWNDNKLTSYINKNN